MVQLVFVVLAVVQSLFAVPTVAAKADVEYQEPVEVSDVPSGAVVAEPVVLVRVAEQKESVIVVRRL